ncbi:MAG: hypothetical protein ACU0A4_13600 [Paracoccaceae bacterium]
MYDHIRVMAGVIVACLPLSATAQDMAGAVTLGLGSYDSSDGFADFTTRSLDGRLDLSYGNGLSLGPQPPRPAPIMTGSTITPASIPLG